MEANGIITREVFATVPPTVEYTLTKKGEKLLPSIVSLHTWGQEFTVWLGVGFTNNTNSFKLDLINNQKYT